MRHPRRGRSAETGAADDDDRDPESPGIEKLPSGRIRRRRLTRYRKISLRLCLVLGVQFLLPLGIWTALGGVETFSPGQRMIVVSYLSAAGTASAVAGIVAIIGSRRLKQMTADLHA